MALIRMSRRVPAPLSNSFLDDLPERMRQMLEGTLAIEPVQNVGWLPAMEIIDNKDSFVVTAELPGLDLKDVDLTIDDDVLTISGEKVEEKKEGKENSQFYLWERRYGSFNRSFTMPGAVDASKVSAEFANGVLTVKLPKSEKVKASAKKIAISAKK